MPKGPQRLTPLELDIMKALWESSPATVQAVRERLAEIGRPLAYTSVQTMLNVLLKKGRVERVLEGRAYEYAPTTTRGQAVRQAVGDLVHRLFDGSASSLVMSLVDTKQLSREELSRLSRLLDRPGEAPAAAAPARKGGGRDGKR